MSPPAVTIDPPSKIDATSAHLAGLSGAAHRNTAAEARNGAPGMK